MTRVDQGQKGRGGLPGKSQKILRLIAQRVAAIFRESWQEFSGPLRIKAGIHQSHHDQVPESFAAQHFDSLRNGRRVLWSG
jgi:hypothetical protein